MVLVKLLVSRAGPGGVQNAGDEIEVDAAEAGRMVAAEQATIVRERAPETTVKKRRSEKASK